MKEEPPFYQSQKTVEEYIQIAEGIDGRHLIEKLSGFLKQHSSVLEIGMGPGKDLDILGEKYEATGSDFSEYFLDLYRSENPKAKLLLLNASNLNTTDRFNCIYSNKVLHHLTKEELKKSIKNQVRILKNDGLICHSFWKGSGQDEMRGLIFRNYEEPELRKLFEEHFKILSLEAYGEMGKDDSLLLIAKLQNQLP